MSFTSQLGTANSKLGNIELGVGPPNSGLTQSVTQTLGLSQGVSVGKTLNKSLTSTLSMTSSAHPIQPKTPIIGYSGGQTRNAYVIDITSNTLLYKLNETTQFNFPASLTKLMTAHLIIQYKGSVLDTENVTLTTADVTPPYSGADMAGFMAGDITTWRGLLYAIFLPSGSDACQCAARIIGHLIYTNAGSTGLDGMARFVQQMNTEATNLGMTTTNYVECSALSQQGSTVNNYSTAKDMSLVAKAALTVSDIAAIIALPTYTLAVTGSNPRNLNFTNPNRFVNGPTLNQQGIKDEDITGGKNGVWNDSGVSHYNLAQIWNAPNGNEVLIVTFNSEGWLELTFDQQGIIYSLLNDFPYLAGTTSSDPDPDFHNVKLLIGYDAVSPVDESSVGRALTNSGVTEDSGAIYGSTGSGGVTSQSQFTRVTNNDSDLEVGSTDATIELFYRAPSGGRTSFSTEYIFFAKADHTTTPIYREWLVNEFNGYIQLFVSTDGVNWTTVAAFILSTVQKSIFFNGAIRHIALVQKSGVWNLYVNGEQGANTITGSPPSRNAFVTVGYYASGVSALGDNDDFRITVGNARYSAYKETIDARLFPRAGPSSFSASSTLHLTQTVVGNKTLNLSLSHSLSMSQIGARTTLASGSSTLTLSESVSYLHYKYASANNALALSQTVAVSITANRSLISTLLPTHSNALGKTLNFDLVQPVPLAQSETGIDTKLAQNTLVFTQSSTGLVSHGGFNFITLTQVVQVNTTINKPVRHVLGVYQTISLGQLLNKNMPQAITLTQSLSLQIVKFASNTLTLTHTATGVAVKPAFSTLTMFHLAKTSNTLNPPAQNTLGLAQTLTVQKSRAGVAHHAFGMNQLARATKSIPVFAGNVLALSQSLWRDLHVESDSQALALTQLAVCSKLVQPKVVQVLPLAQTVTVAKTVVRSLVDTLTFPSSFSKYIGVTNNPYVSVPIVQGIVVNPKRTTVLEGNGLAIVLPSPEFGDKEGPPLKVNIKRSMSGVRRAYVRTVPTDRLIYDFIMDRLKAIELRAFVLANDASLIKLTNFKGEVWMVQITNNPVQFTEVALWQSPWGNKSSVTLEFEGTRIN